MEEGFQKTYCLEIEHQKTHAIPHVVAGQVGHPTQLR